MTTKKNAPLRSVVEESSSVSKAIEKAWTRVGKPSKFSIEVFQPEQKNFLGMSVKPAKVGLFFQDNTSPALSRELDKKEPVPKEERQPRHERPERAQRPKPAERPFKNASGNREPRSHQPQNSATDVTWSDKMIVCVRSWLEKTLRILGKSSITFTTTPSNNCLNIVFSEALFNDRDKERTFFRLSAYLIMQALRTSSKEGFRGFKILMSSTSSSFEA